MAWGEWMVVKMSVEEELRLEASVRDIQNSVESVKVGRLCGSLLRQTYFQQALIKQAVTYIALLEMEKQFPQPLPRRRAFVKRIVCFLTGEA